MSIKYVSLSPEELNSVTITSLSFAIPFALISVNYQLLRY